MAQIIPKAKKDGSMSYLVRVYAGRTQDDKVITKCKTVTPPAGMGKKKAEKWVQEQAVLFEQQVTNGLVLDSDMLLDDLIDRWFEEYANKQLKAKTLYDYRRMRGRISAGLGHLLPRLVFGALNTRPIPGMDWTVRLMESVPFSKSTSDQRRAQISPRRAPSSKAS